MILELIHAKFEWNESESLEVSWPEFLEVGQV